VKPPGKISGSARETKKRIIKEKRRKKKRKRRGLGILLPVKVSHFGARQLKNP